MMYTLQLLNISLLPAYTYRQWYGEKAEVLPKQPQAFFKATRRTLNHRTPVYATMLMPYTKGLLRHIAASTSVFFLLRRGAECQIPQHLLHILWCQCQWLGLDARCKHSWFSGDFPRG